MRRFGLGMLLGLGLLVLLGAGIAAAYLLSHRGNPAATTVVVTTVGATAPAAAGGVAVPRVVGLKEQQALARLAQVGLQPKAVLRPSKQAPAGVVLSQRPDASAKLSEGGRVTLVVAAGAPRVAVPTLTGVPLAQAKAKLAMLGLRSVETQVTSSQKSGTVVDQAPGAGAKLAAGAQVTLSIAKAPPVAVPDVTGEQQAPAQSALRSAGFTPEVVAVPSAQPAGQVTAQHPAAGTTAARGTTVRINVARGAASASGGTTTSTTAAAPQQPSQASVPDVTGSPVHAAVQQLSAAGFLASIQYVPGDDALGTILQQSPAGGSAQTRSHVTINASSGAGGETPVTVPDLAGQTLPQALTALHGAHLRLIYLKRPVTDRAQAGKVVEQTPSAAKQAPPNAQVLVYLGVFAPAG